MVPELTLDPQRRRVLAVAGALVSTAALAGCLSNADPGNNGNDPNGDPSNNTPNAPNTPQVDDETIAELARENRRFALDIYTELVADDPPENLFCSPHSISVALAMTYGGARGETAHQMVETMRYTLGEDVHAAINALATELDERSEADTGRDDADGDPFELSVANTVWGQAEYPFYDEYRSLLEDYYGAGLQTVDFMTDPEAAREMINQWVGEQTAEKIEELLPEGSITEYARLVLTNAIYFQASWQKQFSKAQTADAEFTAIDGATTIVPMMRQSETFPYAEIDGHQVIELPYVGGDVGMVIMLPEAGAFDAFESNLDTERFDHMVGELEGKEGEIRLPRFEYDSGFSLKSILSAMGMEIAFDENTADFSGMADLEKTGESLFIHDVYHDAVVAVDETGTEAAAATGVVVGTDSASMDPFEMIIDRPFLFAIRDRPTDTVLFLGRVVDAGSAQ